MNKIFLTSFAILFISITWVLVTHGPIGSDSYAFISYACGQSSYFPELNTVWKWFPCDTGGIVFYCLLATAIILVSLCFILTKYANINSNYLILAIYGATPLFFLEALRFENDLMGYALALLAIALLEYWLEKRQIFPLFLTSILTFFVAFLFWKGILVFAIVPLAFRFEKNNKIHKILAVIVLIIGGIYFVLTNQIGLFTGAGEMMPFIGFIYLLPFMVFWKHIPRQVQTIASLFVIMGLIQFKFAYFAVPFLAVGLIKWLEQAQPENKKIGVAILLVAMLAFTFFVFPGQFPTNEDKKLAKQAINLSQDENVLLVTSWDYKWLIISNGIAYSPYVDCTFYSRPFYLIARESEQKIDCEVLSTSANGILNYSLRKCV